MLERLGQLCADVVRKKEEIDTQAANLNYLFSKKQPEVDAQIRKAKGNVSVCTKDGLKSSTNAAVSSKSFRNCDVISVCFFVFAG